MKTEPWNKCDVCGKYIAYADFIRGKALRVFTAPNSQFTEESYTTMCPKCREKENNLEK